ncbi:hypothetical protein [Dysgonomonas macrotermitis]|uniref:DKNYY family protein n=1 Tax=Dysgonomonas macrotermitis TaxID=1346286 RepID=A0A1M5DZV8_9BACT|nr:hypothetical protein [Dysgonomonas macrotermitis]SHF72499.1 hypothetical protein SAMN05444362_109105 [Dysgonomonas macrotermitis]
MKRLCLFSILVFFHILYSFVFANPANSINEEGAFYSVYGLSPRTTAVVVNFGEGDADLTELDHIFEEIDALDSIRYGYFDYYYENAKLYKTLQYYDTTGVYRLMSNKRVTDAIRPQVAKEFYIYGTKGHELKKVHDVVFALDECRTNLFAFTLDGFDKRKNGEPLFATTQKLDLKYGNDYQDIELKVNEYYASIEADYADSISTVVYANIGNIYFTYTDDFKWNQAFTSYDDTQCFFPGRAIFRLENDGTLTAIWGDGLDLFGIPCD